MAILDIFRKRKVEPEKKIEEVKPVPQKAAPKPKNNVGAVYGIVKKPHISEKATSLGLVDQYTFEVFPKANKNQIKKAIEGLYGVDVLSVNIIKIPAKRRRLGRSIGFKRGYKKAVIKIKQGQKIEII